MNLASTLSAVHAVVDKMTSRFQYEFNVDKTVSLQYEEVGKRFEKFLFFSKKDSCNTQTETDVSNVTLKNSLGETLPINDIDRIIIAFNDGENPHAFVRINIRESPLLHYETLIHIEAKEIISLNPTESKYIQWKDFLTLTTTISSGSKMPEIYTCVDIDECIYAPKIESIKLENDILRFETMQGFNNLTLFTLRFKAFSGASEITSQKHLFF